MKRRDIHFRASQREYEFLRGRAEETDQTIAAVLRHLVRAAMDVAAARPRAEGEKVGTDPVPIRARRP